MRQERVPGSVVEIDLGDGTTSFGLVNEWSSIAFLDLRQPTGQNVSEADIVGASVLFVLDVSDRSLKSGRWPVVHQIDLKDKQMPVPIFYMYNRLKKVNPVLLIVGSISNEMRPGTLDECRDLEPLVEWEPEDVDERWAASHVDQMITVLGGTQ